MLPAILAPRFFALSALESELAQPQKALSLALMEGMQRKRRRCNTQGAVLNR